MSKVAVVILNWNGVAMMRRYLPSVVASQQLYPDAEVWVADNASTDASVEMLGKEFPMVKTLALDKNWGFAEGYNKALKQIEAEFFVLLNSDVEVDRNWLKPLVDFLDNNPDVAAVQPKLLKDITPHPETGELDMFEYAGAAGGFVDKYGYPYCRGRIFGVVEEDKGQYDEPMEVHWATGACLMIRAKDYLESGGLDSRFFAHNEEIDLCWRLRITGKKIMCLPQSKVYHLGGGTLPQGNPRKTYLNFRNNLTMLYKNLPEKRLKPVLRMRCLLDYVACLQSLLKGNLGDVKAIRKARKDFNNWKNDFNKDRMKIQNSRKLTPEHDLAPISILWQFYARGRKIWSKLPSIVILLLVFLSSTTMMAQDKTRGIGVYPGRPSECFAPTMHQDNAHRNLSLNRAAYHSSAYDYNLTAQLATDGIRAKAEAPRLEVLANGEPVAKADREKAFDGCDWSQINVKGSTATLNFHWFGMKIDADSLAVNYTVVYHKEKATRGYDIIFSDGTRQLVRESMNGLPGTDHFEMVSSDPNKQSDKVETLPARDVKKGYRLNVTDSLSSFCMHLNMPGAAYWSIHELRFYKNGKLLTTELLPSSRFQSVWMSENGGDQWIYVDLGANATLDEVALYWMGKAPQGDVEVSGDTKNWTPIATLPTDKGLTYKFPVTGEGRYVRISVRGQESPYMLSEFEVFGEGGVTPKCHPAPEADGDVLSLDGGDWRLCRASQVKSSGRAVSSYGYSAEDWLQATVPGTVLTSYVNVGAVPDQNFDDNIFYVSDAFFNSNFWYRREFNLPESFKGKQVFINLDGINWKAQLWLNGNKIDRVEGAFCKGRINVTSLLHKDNNVLAIEIEAVAHPGPIKEKTADYTGFNGGALGLDNPTFHASIGWDWISAVRGREIGIWNDVTLTAENELTLAKPFVKTTLNLPDTLATLAPEVYIYNNVGRTVRGTVHFWMGNVKAEQTMEVRPGEATCHFKPKDFPSLSNQNMRLWWPNGYGEPYLYDAGFAFVGENGDTISVTRWKQGVREMRYKNADTELTIYVNGRRVVPLGGNWGFSEQNLNYRGREYDAAVKYHRDMHFNMIRNWVGQTGDEEFYDACDKYGIMVWQDFWLANPADGPDPQDEEMFIKNAASLIGMTRGHSSIALYCGRNEGFPPANLDKQLRYMTSIMHPGILYISSSADDGVSGHGPYWALPAKEYFERQTGKLHSERGMPNIMTYTGLQRTLREEHLWPQSKYWGQHDYTMGGAQRGATFNKLIEAYGSVDDAQTFCDLAQFVNYDGYRAMFESGSKDRMGLLIWMSHSCWPSLTWQCYDYFYEPTSAYFACKKACEPLHIQYNASTKDVEVVNIGVGDHKKLKATVEVINQQGKVVSSQAKKVDSLDDSTISIANVANPDVDGVWFLRLKLKEGKNVVSENTYLLTSKEGDYSSLKQVGPSEVASSVKIDGQSAEVTLSVPRSDKPAVMVHLNLTDGAGQQILPVLYSDNYFHMMPGEKKTVRISWNAEDQHADGVKIDVTGYNVK